MKNKILLIFVIVLLMSVNTASASTLILQNPVVDFYMEKNESTTVTYWEKVDNGLLRLEDFYDNGAKDSFAYLNFNIPTGLAADTNLELHLDVAYQNLKQPEDALIRVFYVANDYGVINHPDQITEGQIILGDELLTAIKYIDYNGVFNLGTIGDQERLYDHSLSLFMTLDDSSKTLILEFPTSPVPEPSSLILGSLAGIAGLVRRFFKAA
ncbi:MAG: hypothetical protein A2Y25_04890 [Candidatus Melainabacteria bacterium GWF2_37_15]|nr:MAG: hypothetical protein A2Y25_04890 [Candidatus Melainabacteria bacterium GWF2_37_15]